MSSPFYNFRNSVSIIIIISLLLNAIGYSSIDISNHNSINLLPILADFPHAHGQEIASPTTDNSSETTQVINTEQQNYSTIVKAEGHFANNQIQDNVVTWIQGGIWSLDIKGSENKTNNSSNMTADFNANFTMIKPDGSLSHNHIIDNFKSENVIFAGNDIVIIGISDIHSDSGIEFSQVPITVHLMGKKVLGLMIDVNKTSGHFSGDNEMFGTLISGLGLESSDTTGSLNSNNLTSSEIPLGANSTSQVGSLNHSMH